MAVFVVAEVGSTHDGDLDKAYRLIRLAADIGANACKFQFWSSSERLAYRRNALAYRAIYHRYMMPSQWLPLLGAECDARGVEFMSTVYAESDIGTVAPFVRRFKVASFESQDLAFLRAHCAFGKPLIVSLGMLSFRETRQLLRRVPQIACVLHCVSAYPCPRDQLQARTIQEIKQRIGVKSTTLSVGLSDHSLSEVSGAVAVAAGASVIEFHLRLEDTDSANPDYPVARHPEAAQRYVEYIREAELLLGDNGSKRLMPAEVAMSAYRVTRSAASRFWRKVEISDDDQACWPWRGRREPRHGYGQAYPNGKAGGVEFAHRVAYKLAVGPIPDGKGICHTCDNPPCVRPTHLFPGSAKDNSDDKIRKGRARLAPPQCGEANSNSRLTREQVAEIRRLHALKGNRQRGPQTIKQLARQFSVSRTTIGNIVARRQWKHA